VQLVHQFHGHILLPNKIKQFVNFYISAGNPIEQSLRINLSLARLWPSLEHLGQDSLFKPETQIKGKAIE